MVRWAVIKHAPKAWNATKSWWNFLSKHSSWWYPSLTWAGRTAVGRWVNQVGKWLGKVYKPAWNLVEKTGNLIRWKNSALNLIWDTYSLIQAIYMNPQKNKKSEDIPDIWSQDFPQNTQWWWVWAGASGTWSTGLSGWVSWLNNIFASEWADWWGRMDIDDFLSLDNLSIINNGEPLQWLSLVDRIIKNRPKSEIEDWYPRYTKWLTERGDSKWTR